MEVGALGGGGVRLIFSLARPTSLAAPFYQAIGRRKNQRAEEKVVFHLGAAINHRGDPPRICLSSQHAKQFGLASAPSVFYLFIFFGLSSIL